MSIIHKNAPGMVKKAVRIILNKPDSKVTDSDYIYVITDNDVKLDPYRIGKKTLMALRDYGLSILPKNTKMSKKLYNNDTWL